MRSAFVLVFLAVCPLACGDEPAPSGAVPLSGPPVPALSSTWTVSYRVPLPAANAPAIDLAALVEVWGGLAPPPGLVAALDFWLRSTAPEPAARFIAAWNALGREPAVVRIEGRAGLDPETGWALEYWRTATLLASCPTGEMSLELSDRERAQLGLPEDGGGPFPVVIETSSAALRFVARREGRLDRSALRGLLARAAAACAADDETISVSDFMEVAVPCDELDLAGPLGHLLLRACAEGRRRFVDWLRSAPTAVAPVVWTMDGMGFGSPPVQFVGRRGAGLDVSYGDDDPSSGSWCWTASGSAGG